MNIKEYEKFLSTKRNYKESEGIIDVELNDVLFDFQKECVSRALKNKVYCFFEGCGLGKTLQQLEWAQQVYKHTGKSVMIVAPLGVTKQTAEEEAPKLGYKVKVCRSQEDVEGGLNITNYESLDKFDTSVFGGVVLDESSILKNFTGSTRIKLKDKFEHTEYKLCCTATPSPNDLTELLNHADFLGIMSTAQSRANFFINDMKTGDWRLKGHAIKDFFIWCCEWSVNIDTPSDLGFDGTNYVLPELHEKTEIIEIDAISEDLENGFFREIETSATAFHKEKKRTAKDRALKCAEIVNSKKEEQFLIWCDTNQEADYLKEFIPESIEVRGADKPNFKEQASQDFKEGKIRVLISKPKIFGYGMNFQKCWNTIFCGLTYSYENYYQALRRIYRFGQNHEVYSWIVMGSTELHILDTINRKKEQQELLKNSMDISLKDVQLKKYEKEIVGEFNKIELPKWI